MKKIILILVTVILIGTIGTLGYVKYNQLNTKDVVEDVVNENLPEKTVIDDKEEDKVITPENRAEVRDEMRIAGCPDQLIVNKMPMMVDPGAKPTEQNSYYIKDGKRVEISEYDSIWVSANCEVPTEVVY